MAFQLSKFQHWQRVLQANGFTGTQIACDDTCLFLLRNDFDDVNHLPGAPPFEEWDGVERISAGRISSTCLSALLLGLTCFQVVSVVSRV
jgi:hypothetical protein